jgi:hypothetical protein
MTTAVLGAMKPIVSVLYSLFDPFYIVSALLGTSRGALFE